MRKFPPRLTKTDYELINDYARYNLPILLDRFFPGWKRESCEAVVLNPTRADSRLGSFKINLKTGVWGDFSTNEYGGDPISLVAYLFKIRQSEACRLLADILGVSLND